MGNPLGLEGSKMERHTARSHRPVQDSPQSPLTAQTCHAGERTVPSGALVPAGVAARGLGAKMTLTSQRHVISDAHRP